jgi:hypothetical protein
MRIFAKARGCSTGPSVCRIWTTLLLKKRPFVSFMKRLYWPSISASPKILFWAFVVRNLLLSFRYTFLVSPSLSFAIDSIGIFQIFSKAAVRTASCAAPTASAGSKQTYWHRQDTGQWQWLCPLTFMSLCNVGRYFTQLN